MDIHIDILRIIEGDHAKGILKLIPDLRERLPVDNLIPGTSHSTLFLKIPGIDTRVMVWCEGNDQYTAYYDDEDNPEYITVHGEM